MEMTIEQKDLARTNRERGRPAESGETFTPDELAQILREANSRQSSPSVATIEEALETARELEIDEAHVLEAARALRARKSRLEELRGRSRARLVKLVRYLGTTAFVVILVGFVAGIPTARLVAFGMGIAAIVLTAQWIRSLFDQRFPPDA
jgi:hypothetical protein